MTTGQPKAEHIERLMANPQEAALFDKVYGDGASLKYLPAVEVDKEQEAVSGITRNIAPAIQKGSKEFLETAQGFSDLLKEQFPGLNYSVRIKDNPDSILPSFDIVSQEQRDEEKAAGIDPFADEKAAGKNVVPEEGLLQGVANVIGEPTTKPEGIAGNLTRGIVQFSTGFVAGGSILKGLGWARNVKGGYNIGRSFVQGGIADFAVFDEHEARLADFVIEVMPSANDTFISYLAADENDTFMEGKMKNVIEGSIVGGGAELLFRLIKFFKGTRKRLDEGDIKKAEDYVKKESKEIEEIRNKVEAEQLELFPDDARIVKDKDVDKVAEQAKGTAGVGEVKSFNIKELRGTDYFKNVKTIIEKIRSGDMDIAELDDFNQSLSFLGDNEDAIIFTRVLAQEINKVTKEFDEIRSHDEVYRDADRMLTDPTNALEKAQRLAKDTDKGDAVTIALRMIYNGLENNFTRKQLLHEAGKISDDEILREFDVLQTIFRLNRQIGTNTARMLAIRKELVNNSPRSKKRTNKLLEEAEVVPVGKDNKQARLEIVKKIGEAKKDRKGIIAILDAVREGISVNNANKLFINAILSNPKTHAINMTSNLIMAVMRPIEQFIGSAITLNTSGMTEAINTAVGLLKFYEDAFIMARQSFNKSDSILDKNSFKVDLPKNVFNKRGNIITKTIESPTRFLSAEDEFFKQINYRSKVYAQAVTEGIRLGKSKKKIFRTSYGRKYSELDAYVEKRFNEAFLPDKSANEKVFKHALEYAQENTFTKALGKDTPGKVVQDAINKVPIFRQIIPFVRTPINILRAVNDRTPLGFAREAFRKEIFSKDPNIKASAYGKLMMGTALFAMAGRLAYNQQLTGSIPKDKNIRQQKFDTGWRPYSVKVADKYYSFERLDPFGMFLGIAADIYDISLEVSEDERNAVSEAGLLYIMSKMDVDDYTDIGLQSLGAIGRNVSSKSYMKSLHDFLYAAVSGDPEEIKKYTAEKLGAFVPNVFKGAMNDPLYRDVRNLTDTLKTKVPFYGEALPSYNALGETRSRGQSWWDSFLMPITVTEDTNDAVMAEFDRLGVGFSPLDKKQGYAGNIDLMDFRLANADGSYNQNGQSAYERWNELLSQSELRKEIEELIKTPLYQNRLTDKPIDDTLNYQGSKITLLKQKINKFKKITKIKLLSEGYITENNLKLDKAYTNDRLNNIKARIGSDLLPTK